MIILIIAAFSFGLAIGLSPALLAPKPPTKFKLQIWIDSDSFARYIMRGEVADTQWDLRDKGKIVLTFE